MPYSTALKEAEQGTERTSLPIGRICSPEVTQNILERASGSPKDRLRPCSPLQRQKNKRNHSAPQFLAADRAVRAAREVNAGQNQGWRTCSGEAIYHSKSCHV